MNGPQPENLGYDPREVFARTPVFDGLSCANFSRDLFAEMQQGGLTAVNCASVLWENFRQGIDYVAMFHRWFAECDDLIRPVRTVDDILLAKGEGRVGIALGFQNTSPVEDRLENVEVFKRLGVGFMQLTYNSQNLSGAGYLEPSDGGLSGFGRELLAEMHRTGVVCDLSHVGLRTSLEAIDASPGPVCFSHCLPSSLHDVPRNKPDELFRACAEKGGMIGLSLFAPGLRAGNAATVADYAEAVAYMVDLVGEDYVGLGCDFSLDHPRPGAYQTYASRDKGYARNMTSFATAKIEKPEGIRRYPDLPNVAVALGALGWSEERLVKVLGGNWLRFLGHVWPGRPGAAPGWPAPRATSWPVHWPDA